MFRLATNAPNRVSAPASRRQGMTLTSMMLVSAFVFIGFAAVAIDLSVIAERRHEAQQACDAAALAACGELHDPAPLFSGLQSSESPEELQARKSRLAKQAHNVGIEFAALNTLNGKPLELVSNPANDPSGEIVLGWADDPTRDLIAWQGGSLLNSAQVQVGHQGQLSVTMLVGRLLGVERTKIAATSRATLDQRIYGFEPAGEVPIPALPILVDHKSWDEQFRGDKGVDQLAQSEGSKTFRAAADGIREITLVFNGGELDEDEDRPNAKLIALGNAKDLSRQIKFGFNRKDVEYNDGRLTLGQRVVVSTPAWGLRSELRRIQGEKRIFALGDIDNASEDLAVVTGFVAGRVIASSHDGSDRIRVVFQPCLMTTPTALVDAEAARNDFIGKLMLTR